MATSWGRLPALLLAGAALVPAGCGGSGSSAQRSQLVRKLSAQQQGSLPQGLGSCVTGKAGQLPISQLRELADSGANPSPAAKQTAVQLVVACLEAGQGLGAIRSELVQGMDASFPSSLPASFRSCVDQKANQIPAGELSGLIAAYGNGDQSAVQSRATTLGRDLGLQCLGEPGVLSAVRELFLAPIRQFAQSSTLSSAFRQCVLGKAEKVSLSQLKQFVLDPAHATAVGTALGRGFAKACIAGGIKP